MSFGWHPREHRAALDGMLMLTLEERGAYNTLLDLIYDRAGPIPDDSRWLAGWMGVSLKRWSTIRASLLVKDKIFAVNLNGVDSLMNQRAAEEIEKQAKLHRNSRETGAKGGRKRAENAAASNENSDLVQGTLEGSLKLKTKTQTQSSVVSSNEEPTAAEPQTTSQKAWLAAKTLLIGQGGMSSDASGKFFGKLLAQYGLEASDLLGAIGEAESSGTADPQGWLTKAAQARQRRRQPTGPPKRVGFV